jgi:D-glycero-D-manno-heptose 1,7-bisphosphate phosphatase
MVAAEEKCRPCSLHGNEPCYREEQYCFTQLSVDTVYDKVNDMLDRIKLEPAVFIDRDGCLIEDKNYLADPQKVEFIAGSLDATRSLKEAGYKIVVVSNQSGVARGFFSVETVEKVNQRIRESMRRADCEPDDIHFCPYHPDGDDPDFTGDSYDRKPKPGMLEKAAIKHGIDIKRSYVIGDKYTDIQCGKAAGTSTILVLTGKGGEAADNLPSHRWLQPDYIVESLKIAADTVLSQLPKDDSRRPIL